MSQQQIFDKVAGHLLTQGVRSVGYGGACAYRGIEGNMCAIGCLIDADHYSVDLEGMCADDQDILEAIKGSLNTDIDREKRHLLVDLQSIHDDYQPNNWQQHLSALADRLELTFNGDQYAK